MTSRLKDPSHQGLVWYAEALPTGRLGTAAVVWDALLEQLFDAHPMLNSVFIENLLRSFGSGREHLCIGSDAMGTARAMAIVERVGVGRWQSFSPLKTIGPTLAGTAEQMHGLLESLPGRAMQVDLLCVDSQLADLTSNTPRPNSFWHESRAAIEVEASFESYWSVRPAELREDVERHCSKLTENSAPLAFVARESHEEIAKALERHAALEAEEPNAETGAASPANSRRTAFHQGLIGDAGRKGAARVFELRRNGELIASQLALIAGYRLALLELAYHQSLAALSPDQVLLRYIIEHAFRERRVKWIEFYGNRFRETEAWSNSTRAIRHIKLCRFAHWCEVTAAKRALAARISILAGQPYGPRANDSHLSVRTYASVDALPADALKLFDDAERRYGIQAGADWFGNLCRTVPPLGENAVFALLSRAGEAVAVLPLVVTTSAGRKRTLSALSNFYTSLYAPPIRGDVSSDELAYLLKRIVSQLQVGAIDFGPMDPHAQEFTALRSAMYQCGLVVIPSFYFGNWFMTKPESFTSYMASRPGAVRSTVRRMRKRFSAAGGRIEIVCSENGVARGLLAYEQVYAGSWKQPEPFPKFIPGLVTLAARRGWLRLGIAWLVDRPIAAQIWLVGNGRVEIFKLAYDEQYKSFSAGTLLTATLMEEALADPEVKIVDYLTGDDSYKRDWMTRRNERWGLTAHDPLSLSGTVGLIRRAAKRIFARVVG